MPLNIKNPEVERLAAQVAAMMGETKTEAIRRALQERKRRLSFKVTQKDTSSKLMRFLEKEIWPVIPKTLLGKRMRRKEEDHLLGYGREGV
jgi:antitoxin VapB